MEQEIDLVELEKTIAEQVLEERGYALVWMSAGNSYFKENIIKKILNFVGENFIKTLVMAPDEPAEHTFKALGYEGNDIKRKARLNANLLQNRAKRIISLLDNERQNKFKVIEWIDEIIPNNAYQARLKEISYLYSENKKFRDDALETTRNVLKGKIKEDGNIISALKEAVNYLLKELAFVLASPEIYKTKKVTYVYHHEWPIFQKLISGYYNGLKRDNLGFLLLK